MVTFGSEKNIPLRPSPMLWPKSKQVGCDCLPQYWHLLPNHKFLCNLMRQGENEAQQCGGNGVMIHLLPENKLSKLCREHWIHGHESKQEKGRTSMAKVDFLSLFESCKQSLLRVTRTGSALSVTSWVVFWPQ